MIIRFLLKCTCSLLYFYLKVQEKPVDFLIILQRGYQIREKTYFIVFVLYVPRKVIWIWNFINQILFIACKLKEVISQSGEFFAIQIVLDCLVSIVLLLIY